MTHAEAVEGGLIKTMSEEEQKTFTPPEVLLYRHPSMYMYVLVHTDTDELKKVIDMLRQPEFDAGQFDPDLHERMKKAIEDGRIKCFNMRESDLDGDEDFNFWTREMEDAVRGIFEDPVFKGNQHFNFELDLDEAGERLFRGEANAGVAFQIGRLRYKFLCSKYIQVHTSTYWYVLVCTCMYMYVLVCSCMNQYALGNTYINTVFTGSAMEQPPLQLLCTLMVVLSQLL
jgi:hypothetical protein